MKRSEKFLFMFIVTFLLTILMLGAGNFFFDILDNWSWNIAFALGNATGNAVLHTFIINTEE